MFETVALNKFHRLINHGPCVIVTTGDDQRANAAPVQWNMPLNDDPPLVVLALDADNFTCELAVKTGEFVLNVPEVSLIPAVRLLGRKSGRELDKIKEAGLSLEAGIKVKTPHLRECLGFIECKLRDFHEYDGVRSVVGEAIHAAAWPDKFKDGRYLPDAKTIHHMGGLVFAVTGERIS